MYVCVYIYIYIYIYIPLTINTHSCVFYSILCLVEPVKSWFDRFINIVSSQNLVNAVASSIGLGGGEAWGSVSKEKELTLLPMDRFMQRTIALQPGLIRAQPDAYGSCGNVTDIFS